LIIAKKQLFSSAPAQGLCQYPVTQHYRGWNPFCLIPFTNTKQKNNVWIRVLGNRKMLGIHGKGLLVCQKNKDVTEKEGGCGMNDLSPKSPGPK
jgi:hypothetical protein